ncbi:MAG: hypothetical protein NTY04_04100 [Candidatus Staskawiczbacteria bacterium]|nr:hypothetical protein [Candidatus Staskawiczbacteria bacterium]
MHGFPPDCHRNRRDKRWATTGTNIGTDAKTEKLAGTIVGPEALEGAPETYADSHA